jgi:hypothetical protein
MILFITEIVEWSTILFVCNVIHFFTTGDPICLVSQLLARLKIQERRLALSKFLACTSNQERMQEAMQHLNCSGTMYRVCVARWLEVGSVIHFNACHYDTSAITCWNVMICWQSWRDNNIIYYLFTAIGLMPGGSGYIHVYKHELGN